VEDRKRNSKKKKLRKIVAHHEQLPFSSNPRVYPRPRMGRILANVVGDPYPIPPTQLARRGDSQTSSDSSRTHPRQQLLSPALGLQPASPKGFPPLQQFRAVCYG
jgi:hypothetical protein